MGLLSRIEQGGILARLTSPALQKSNTLHFVGLPQIPGIRLDYYTALGVAAVFGCVTVIAKSLAGSPWEIVDENPTTGDWTYRRSNPAYRIFNVRPNEEMTPQAFKEQMYIVALLWGNSFAEIEWDQGNRPRALWPLDPERCWLDRNPANQKILHVTNFNKPDVDMDYRDVYDLAGPGIGMGGFDMVALAARTIAQALAQNLFRLKFWEHGSAMGGVLSTESPTIKQEELEKLQEKLQKKVGGAENAFRMLVLSAGLKYTPIHQTGRDAESNDTAHFIIEEICRFYGVPPHKIQHLLRSTNNNIEHQGLEFTRDCLTRWARFGEEEATYKLLTGRLKCKIDMDALAEGDAKTMAETDSILANNALRTRNELRQKRGWNSLGTIGDLLTVQGAMTTLQAIKDAPAPGANRQTPGEPKPVEAPMEREEREQRAASALFAAAMKRGLVRQTNRAVDADKHSKGSAEFVDKMLQSQVSHLAYVNAQSDDVLAVLAGLGIDFDAAAIRACVARYVTEEQSLILSAYQYAKVENWCDIEARATAQGNELARAMKGIVCKS